MGRLKQLVELPTLEEKNRWLGGMYCMDANYTYNGRTFNPRVVIHVSTSSKISGGTGTESDPYITK